MGRRRQSNKKDLFDLLFELTGMIWQVGAVITGLLIILALIALRWVVVRNITLAASPLLGNLTESFGWFLYLLPLVIFAIAWLFGKATYDAYREQNRF